MLRSIIFVAVCVLMTACYGCDKSTKPGPVKKPPVLSPQERAAAGLPAAGELTLANDEDGKHVLKLDSAVDDALGRYLEPLKVKWKICAARPVGDYILLWIGFPEVIDGGRDLIYSVKEQQIVGEFLGGYLG